MWLGKPITSEQATLVAQCFGVSIDEITHARDIVRNNPKNEV